MSHWPQEVLTYYYSGSPKEALDALPLSPRMPGHVTRLNSLSQALCAALLLFQQGSYLECQSQLVLLQNQLESLAMSLPSNLSRTWERLLVRVKSNLVVLHIMQSQYDQCQQGINDLLSLIYSSAHKNDLLQLLLYTLFRSTSLIHPALPVTLPHDSTWNSIQAALQFYLSNEQSALDHLRTAYQLYTQEQDMGSLLVTLQGISHLTPHKKYIDEQNTLLKQPFFQSIDSQQVFKGSEIRLACTKEIACCLLKLEQSFDHDHLPQDYSLIQKALLLRLKKNIIICSQIDDGEIPQTIQELKNTVLAVQNEKNPIILKEMAMQSYCQESVMLMRHSVDTLFRFVNHLKLQSYFNNIYEYAHAHRPAALPIAYAMHSHALIQRGIYLIKCNSTSNGRSKRFIKYIAEQSLLRWAPKEKNMDQKGKYQEYYIRDIIGILYGKLTKCLNKNYNRHLQETNCFSLILKNRSLDFYCSSSMELLCFVGGLSNQILKINKNRYCLTGGQVLWKRVKYLLAEQLVKRGQGQKGYIQQMSLVQLIIYGRLKCIL